jgi:Ca2+/H+ antiporter
MQNMYEIMTIIDNNKDKLSDKDYIQLCTHLQNMYNSHNADSYDIDREYSDKATKFMVNLSIINVLVHLILYALYTNIFT